ncbi:MAG: nucleotidyl transferase AbiEii/AbiGii toxin family protein [Bradymonadia bacterium]
MVNAPDDLDEQARHVVLRAVFQHPELGEHLILKGAMAVEPLTGRRRSTRDVDLTARDRFCTMDGVGRDLLGSWLREAVADGALSKLGPDWRAPRSPSVEKRPAGRRHRLGFDAFKCKVTLQYRGRAEYAVELDVSFGDFTGAEVRLVPANGRLIVGTGPDAVVRAYAADECVAEKLRAFLQKLPRYLKKIGRDYPDAELPRVRDLLDVHGLASRPEPLDWVRVAYAFRKKCREKFVDCWGPADFAPDGGSVETYRRLYDEEFGPVLPTFDEVWTNWLSVVQRVGEHGGFGGAVPLPEAELPGSD